MAGYGRSSYSLVDVIQFRPLPVCYGGILLDSFDIEFYCEGSYLVDPASSHMLVSKIKPCMSKYKHLYCETANGSLNQLSFI